MLIRGTGAATVTDTAKLQASVRMSASVAVQDTVVDPTGKLAPLTGEHTIWTGLVPPETLGEGYVTIAGAAATCAVCDPGQEIFGALVAGDGRDGDPQPPARRAANSATRYRRLMEAIAAPREADNPGHAYRLISNQQSPDETIREPES